MTDPNAKVRAVLERLIASGEVGLQVAAYKDGDLVIDTWAGMADRESGRAVDGDTIFPSFSSAKGPTSTAAHIAAERGLFDYDDSISKYWPEFAVGGKAPATIRHALAHQVGVPDDPKAYNDDPENWDAICAEIAAMPAQWEPGTRSSYHGTTFGWLLGEVVRRTSGKPFGQFIRDEICTPLGLESLFMGTPDAEQGRVATLYSSEGDDRLRYNTAPFRRACTPAAGLITNARSLARIYAALANGGEFAGARILTPERIDMAAVLQTDEVDGRFKIPTRKALGYWLAGPGLTAAEGAGPKAFGHAGSGGSAGFADRERNYAFAITKNGLTSTQEAQPTAVIVEQAVEEALGLK
jgi:CubicO group peptidase (beta-lactamase class C family)